jgi:hypothetical protein
MFDWRGGDESFILCVRKGKVINTTDSPTHAFCRRQWSHLEDRREMEADRHAQQTDKQAQGVGVV